MSKNEERQKKAEYGTAPYQTGSNPYFYYPQQQQVKGATPYPTQGYAGYPGYQTGGYPGYQPGMPTMPTAPTAPAGGATGQAGLAFEESYIENILRLNKGKKATVYMTFENNQEWNAKVFSGIIEAAGRDHIVLSDPKSGKRYLLLMVYLDYITFPEELNYSYPV